MWTVQCPHCSTPTPGRCASTAAGRSVTECTTCDRAVEERQSHTHQLFLRRAHDTPLPLVTPDLSFPSSVDPQPNGSGSDDDPFHPTGFITAFSTWSLEPSPVFARSASSFAGHLAELERALGVPPSNDPAGPMVSVDQLRAYLQILDVASILELDREIVDHAFQLFRDCSSATCLRNRSVEALATAALVQAIREAQEPRTLQEISAASNLPQKEIGKYIKILGESLKLSQPINSNSISVHMPRFCSLLQLNKSAQELAAHIGEVVINKCFCTRRNPISISAAAIYLACQLEDKRKTQAEICKITGLTEVTLRKVYKELLENWDDLLPPNYTPAVPPEKAFPMTIITSGGRSSTPRVDADTSRLNLHQDKDRLLEIRKISRPLDAMDIDPQVRVREEVEYKSCPQGRSLASLYTRDLNQAAFWKPQFPFGATTSKPRGEKEHKVDDANSTQSDCEQKVEPDSDSNAVRWMGKGPALTSSQRHSSPWKQHICSDSAAGLQGVGDKNKCGDVDGCHGND